MSSNSPTVSVIVPCYNQGQYLDDAVDSVLAQTYQDFEIIVINGGSTDRKTIDILQNYQKPKTKVIHTEDKGLATARNDGIQVSCGKYILPLDGDDKIGSGYLLEAVKILESNANVGIVYCQADFFGNKFGKWALPEYKFPDILLSNVIFCSGVFRKSDWQLVGGYNPNMIYGWEDYDLWLSIIELGREVYRIPEVFFFYRRRSGSMVERMGRENYIYSYTQLFRNHPQLYTDNISAVFAEIVDLKATLDSNILWKLQKGWLKLKRVFS
ncbi:glycosyltransferase [Tumidithrix elongata RA019]|uniref:Glycosyltransferase n=1 Tax=Tumidithrix elongata BACA0141 TaxID=2716417 RepID=A0AAW9PY35_9CYAN|nr:glycosyltransferase [Tumidithrix elongata RA019]